jgi:hypothetical protein
MWKDKIVPGFIGEAMRNSQVKGVEKEEDLGNDVNPLKRGIADLDTQVEHPTEIDHQDLGTTPNVKLDDDSLIMEDMRNITIPIEPIQKITPSLMNTATTHARVLAGKDRITLEKDINAFLAANPGIDIVNATIASTSAGIYYTLLYKKQVERV